MRSQTYFISCNAFSWLPAPTWFQIWVVTSYFSLFQVRYQESCLRKLPNWNKHHSDSHKTTKQRRPVRIRNYSSEWTIIPRPKAVKQMQSIRWDTTRWNKCSFLNYDVAAFNLNYEPTKISFFPEMERSICFIWRPTLDEVSAKMQPRSWCNPLNATPKRCHSYSTINRQSTTVDLVTNSYKRLFEFENPRQNKHLLNRRRPHHKSNFLMTTLHMAKILQFMYPLRPPLKSSFLDRSRFWDHPCQP